MVKHPFLRRLYARVVFYPTLAWNALLGRVLKVRHWWDFVDPHVIVGAYPFARDVPAMVDAGVAAVVNTCEEYAGPEAAYREAGIEQLRIPTTDFTHPKIEDVRVAVEFINRFVKQGKTVYVHCKAGRARSATVAMAWLIRHRGLSPEQAQKELLEKRPHVNPNVFQRPVIRQFANES